MGGIGKGQETHDGGHGGSESLDAFHDASQVLREEHG
jgi:hypothetical protein